MTGQDFIALCLPWWNADNLFNENPVKEIQTNNGVSYTADYFTILSQLPSPSLFRGAFTLEIQHTIGKCELTQGLYRRSPTSDLDNAHDDHHSVATLGAVSGERDLAEGILKHGQDNGWCYNVKDPDAYTETLDHSRHIGVIQHYQMAAKKPLGVIDQLQWCISVSIPGSHSGNRLRWQRYLTHTKYPHKTMLTILGAQIFKAWFKKKYKDGLAGQMYAMHFERHGKTHPFSIALWGRLE